MTAARTTCLLVSAASVAGAAIAASPGPADPRLREVTYDPGTVITVPVKRGVVTLVMLDAGEAIAEVAAGLGGDCGKPESAWCVAAQPGGRTLFVKAKGAASAPNNLAVVTDRRAHAFRFEVLADDDRRQPVHRLHVKAPAARPPAPDRSIGQQLAALLAVPVVPPQPSPRQLVAERLQARPEVRNTTYSVAEGLGSADIVPTLVFDDGRFTYLRFAGNGALPAVFDVQGDGSETLVNVRMEDDLLVADRVSRRLVLRAGTAVVTVWNDAFDDEGVAPYQGTTAPGVQRVLKGDASATRTATPAREPGHD